jgi:hypothetical protein
MDHLEIGQFFNAFLLKSPAKSYSHF